MLNIAYCDDDKSVLEQIGSLLLSYRAEHGLDSHITAYDAPIKMLDDIDSGAVFDIIFLDVIMPGENGIETAAEIRARNDTVKIIFLTSSDEYAVQSYTVGAFYYQLKPITKDSFYSLLNSVIASCESEQSKSLVLHGKSGITRIDLSQLEYCEINAKTIYFYMINGHIHTIQGNMDKISEILLRHGCFFRAHRSYTINLNCITSINSREVIMAGGAAIPLPRGKFTQLKDAFLAQAFRKGWENNG